MKPRYWDSTRELARLARWALDQREARYPAAIARGTIGQEEAEADIRAWRAIVADREYIDQLQGFAGDDVPLADKRQAIEIAISRFEERAARYPNDVSVDEILACLRALAWHYAQPHTRSALFFATISIELRAERAAQQRKAA